MKTSNIIIFLIVVIVIAGIFGFAILDAKDDMEDLAEENLLMSNSNTLILNDTTGTNTILNDVNTVDTNTTQPNDSGLNLMLNSYKGEWFISRDEYINSEKIDELMDRREDSLISDEEFENQLQQLKNDQIAQLDVDEYYGNTIKFDFELTGPAPTQRVARIEDMVVQLNSNIGTFTYIDNWGTSGNGTITLKDNQIELKLETTKVNQGTLWGVEGSYVFSYRLSE